MRKHISRKKIAKYPCKHGYFPKYPLGALLGIKRMFPLFLAGAILIGGIPIPTFAAEVPIEETDVSADDGLINPCTENQDDCAASYETELYMEDADNEDIRAHKKLRDFMNKYLEHEFCLKDDNPQYQLSTSKVQRVDKPCIFKENRLF